MDTLAPLFTLSDPSEGAFLSDGSPFYRFRNEESPNLSRSPRGGMESPQCGTGDRAEGLQIRAPTPFSSFCNVFEGGIPKASVGEDLEIAHFVTTALSSALTSVRVSLPNVRWNCCHYNFHLVKSLLLPFLPPPPPLFSPAPSSSTTSFSSQNSSDVPSPEQILINEWGALSQPIVRLGASQVVLQLSSLRGDWRFLRCSMECSHSRRISCCHKRKLEPDADIQSLSRIFNGVTEDLSTVFALDYLGLRKNYFAITIKDVTLYEGRPHSPASPSDDVIRVVEDQTYDPDRSSLASYRHTPAPKSPTASSMRYQKRVERTTYSRERDSRDTESHRPSRANMFYLSGMMVDQEVLLSILLSSLYVTHSNDSIWFPGMCGWILTPPQRDLCDICRDAVSRDAEEISNSERRCMDQLEAKKGAKIGSAGVSVKENDPVWLPFRTDMKAFVTIEKSAVHYDVLQSRDDPLRSDSFVRAILAIVTLHITSIDLPSGLTLAQLGKDPLSFFWTHFPRTLGRSRDVHFNVPDTVQLYVIQDFRTLKSCDYFSVRSDSSSAFLDFWKGIGYSLIFSSGSLRFRYR